MTQTEWIMNGEVGVSSKTMWGALNGAIGEGARKGLNCDVPHDPSDFRRCRLFVEQCGITSLELEKIKTVIPWFAPFIDNWFQLIALYDEESASGKCQKLYERMKVLEEEAYILAGWEKTGPGSWRFGKKGE